MSEPEGRRHLMPNSYRVTQASGGFILLYHDLTLSSVKKLFLNQEDSVMTS